MKTEARLSSETAERAALPPRPPGADPTRPLGVPRDELSPHACPSISLGDYSVCFVFLPSPARVPFSRMAEAELHKERLQAIAVSPLFLFLFYCLGWTGTRGLRASDMPAQ